MPRPQSVWIPERNLQAQRQQRNQQLQQKLLLLKQNVQTSADKFKILEQSNPNLNPGRASFINLPSSKSNVMSSMPMRERAGSFLTSKQSYTKISHPKLSDYPAPPSPDISHRPTRSSFITPNSHNNQPPTRPYHNGETLKQNPIQRQQQNMYRQSKLLELQQSKKRLEELRNQRLAAIRQ